jgi:hypothetical protein
MEPSCFLHRWMCCAWGVQENQSIKISIALQKFWFEVSLSEYILVWSFRVICMGLLSEKPGCLGSFKQHEACRLWTTRRQVFVCLFQSVVQNGCRCLLSLVSFLRSYYHWVLPILFPVFVHECGPTIHLILIYAYDLVVCSSMSGVEYAKHFHLLLNWWTLYTHCCYANSW